MNKYLVILMRESYVDIFEVICNFNNIKFEKISGTYRYYVWCTEEERKYLHSFDYIAILNIEEI